MTSIFSLMTLGCSASSIRPEAACVLIWCHRTIRATGFDPKVRIRDVGEIDFIVAGSLTSTPFEIREVEGRAVQLETMTKSSPRRSTTGDRKPSRVEFSISPLQHGPSWSLRSKLCAHSGAGFPGQGAVEKLNPEFVDRAVAQLMIMPDYQAAAADSLDTALAVLDEVLSSPKKT